MLALATIASVVCGNLLLKLGAMRSTESGLVAWVVDWRILSGLALFSAGAVFYLLLLRRLPLNVAQSFLVAQFVGVILGSYFILHEPLPLIRLGGIVLIIAGIVVVSFSYSAG